MLRFFRNIRQKLLENGNLRKYFWYALGEILLVVIGILIALQINNWNEERKLRKTETVYLDRLYEEVRRDSLFLQGAIFLSDYKVGQANAILDHLKKDAAVIDSSNFVRNVLLLGRGGIHRPYIPAYEEMISTGMLDVIRNAEITNLISRYYNRTEGLESFAYTDAERSRSEYMRFTYQYFSALIMDYIWEMGEDETPDFTVMKDFGVDIDAYLDDPSSMYYVQNLSALNSELSRLFKQNMENYTVPLLEILRQNISSN